ncbi:MAG: GNAT family N-acetyltransferase [Chloroflexi bacterium]|nr:GNAT family N-acetyltransferase [Chloroflexota bacterium]
MKLQIAVATIGRAPDIARVAAEALAAEVASESAHVKRALDAGYTYVALADGSVAGFVSNFITCDGLGGSRFELDLLAVAPGWQGRGIGARLVGRSMKAARLTDARTIRALVRRDNSPMQRVCARSGLQRSARAFQLWVSRAPQPAGKSARDHAARVIAVDTLTYGGYWLEGALSQSAIDAARSLLRAQPARSVIGAVVAEQDRRAIDLLRANAFVRMGEFDWWSLSL